MHVNAVHFQPFAFIQVIQFGLSWILSPIHIQIQFISQY